ncbi:MAG: phosphatase [Spirosomaceae bacterium]|nr:phosphatase [Spirosomataceae bacterium]
MKKAFIDLGTNTFHLLIVEFPAKEILFKTSVATQLGKGGINAQTITPEAIERALKVLKEFRLKINEFEITSENVIATATSAVRNAKNQQEFLNEVSAKTAINIQVISGDEEAILIYEGITQAVKIEEPSLIVDIGGGSVEFIIANNAGILWKQSFEIGGQRLIEIFMKTDPISAKAVDRLNNYFLEELLPLTNAVHQYKPSVLVGSSGSFDTLNDIHWMNEFGHLPLGKIGFDYPIGAFKEAYELFVYQSRSERMKIPGMIDLRVEMIVVAVCLIRFLLETYQISEIKISNYALKEGLMSRFS